MSYDGLGSKTREVIEARKGEMVIERQEKEGWISKISALRQQKDRKKGGKNKIDQILLQQALSAEVIY